MNSPAEIMAAALVAKGLCSTPGSTAGPLVGAWPLYVGHMPDSLESPDNVVCLYDQAGNVDGRLMRTGETVVHPGYQLRVRAVDYPTGYNQIAMLQRGLDSIRNLNVAIGAAAYIICGITQSGAVLALGQEPDAKKRNGFTLNGTITYREMTQ